MSADIIPFRQRRRPQQPQPTPPVLSDRDHEILNNFGHEAHALGIDGMAEQWGMTPDLAEEILDIFSDLAPVPARPRLVVVQ